MNVREITSCRGCSASALVPVLDLGNLAVSDFVTDETTVERAPLALVRCAECGLVQLQHTVDRDRCFKTYHYRSGVNETMVAALRDVARDAETRVVLNPGDAVLDIGCNDGTLLRQFPKGVRKIGFDPSDVAREAWVSKDFDFDLVRDFFPTQRQHKPIPCKIVTAIACFYDLDNPGLFLAEAKRWLHPDGVLVIQLQDLGAMVRANAFDNVCHEHLTYWTPRTLQAIALKHGLSIAAVRHVDVNGGSLRFTLRHAGAAGVRVFGRTDGERPGDLEAFARTIGRLKEETGSLLEIYRRQGKRVLGYAASTKANTLLQFYGLGPAHIEAFMERSPHKWGKRTVTGIPIISEEEGRAMNPAFLFVGAWQFADAFARREAALLTNGTKLIVPLPMLRLVGGVGADVLAQVA